MDSFLDVSVRIENKGVPVTPVVRRDYKPAELDSPVTRPGAERGQYSGGETVVAAVSRQVQLFLAAH